MNTLIFDPFAGISGDMTLAALLDLGLDEQWLRNFVRDLGIGAVDVHIERVDRRGITAPHIQFVYPAERAHRHLRHVIEIIDAARAPERARELSREAFRRIAAAEARVHGTTIEKVHFHEVGATDAILDVVCVMTAVGELGFDEFRTNPVAIGSGWIDIEHGRYPVPAPATLGILEGITVTGAQLAGECTTPTGAAILATLTSGRATPRRYVAGRIGFGAGSRDPQDRPNVLRLIEAAPDGEDSDAHGPDASASDHSALDGDALDRGSMWLVQADLDDLPPEYAAAAQAALLDAGAADAVIVPVTMKKGRPALRLEALCTTDRVQAVERALFASTTTIGIRRWPVQRTVLEREVEERDWRGQRIRFKRVRLPDGSWREKPEYEDVVNAARALGMTPWQVRTELDR
jgi:pyridinium-3,5-bisthiocarboxylic acid mononucleotide nickel chelatase